MMIKEGRRLSDEQTAAASDKQTLGASTVRRQMTADTLALL